MTKYEKYVVMEIILNLKLENGSEFTVEKS
jgi:hypothetical protein